MDLGLKGKTVLITGGSKGIGLAAAQSFAAEGCTVHIAARNADALERAREGILASHAVEVHCHAVDLRDGEQLRALAKRCEGVDILINNAGDIPGGSIETLNDDAWRHAWELKVFGYVNLTREIFAQMKARQSGTIVNVMGMASQNPSFEYVCGATANAGLAAFTQGMGRGSTKFGVRVMGVHPPATLTDRIIKLMKDVARVRYGDETRTEDVIRDGLFPQPISAKQVGDAIVFLASPKAAELSGIVVNLGP